MRQRKGKLTLQETIRLGILFGAFAIAQHRPAVAFALSMTSTAQAQPDAAGSCFGVAHIASPLIRRRLPGLSPSPESRSRISMLLLAEALTRAKKCGADAIVITGSVLSAPPPLRNSDAHGYYKLERAQPLAEAEADYAEVRALLESTGLPFEVTPGGEDCIEAFEKVFGMQSSARTIGSTNSRRMDFSAYAGEDSMIPKGHPEELPWPTVDSASMDDPAARAIADFSAQLARERAAGQQGAARQAQNDPLESARGQDVEDATGKSGAHVGCNACKSDLGGCGSGGDTQRKEQEKDNKTEQENKAQAEEMLKTRLLRVPINSTHERGWATPAGERADQVVMARFCDHIPLVSPPQRLEYERRLWAGVLASSDHLPQCHVQTFSMCKGEVVDEDGNPKLKSSHKLRRQDEGESGLDGALFFEHEDLRKRMEASSKLILSLSTLPVSTSSTGARVHGSTEGRVTFVQTPSLSVYPHRFTMSTLSAPSVSIDPRLSKSQDEINAKAEVIKHRHFWGHEEIECGDNVVHGQNAIVFLDRDGVINTLPKYTTGPALMELVDGAALAICKLKAAGFQVVVVSSQSCVARGYVTTSHVHATMDRMCRLLREQASAILGQRDDPDLAQPDCIIFSLGCDKQPMHIEYNDVSDAKPRPTGLLRACKALHVNTTSQSFRGYMVGDRETDIGAGAAAGCKSLLVRTGQGKETESNMLKKGNMGCVFGVADSIVDAVDMILADFKKAEHTKGTQASHNGRP